MFVVTNIKLYRTLHFDTSVEKEQYSNFWHCDHYLKTLTKLFIFLHEVKIENGPFEYYDLSQTKKIVKKGYSGRNKNYDKSIFDKSQKERVLGNRSDSICRTTEVSTVLRYLMKINLEISYNLIYFLQKI